MILESAVADALYLNWAVPAAALPPLPPGALRYDLVRLADGSSAGFFSLVLFRQVGVHLRGADWLALSYPQANARLCVRDATGVAGVLLLRQLAPAWVVPIARAMVRQPLSAGILDFPRGMAGSGFDAPRRWKFQAGAAFEAEARPGAGPSSGTVPKLGEWNEEAAFFRERPRSYWTRGAKLRRVETDLPAADVVPMSVELLRTDWLDIFLPFAPERSWTDLHSAFLVPEVRLAFLLGSEPELAVPAQVPAAS